MPDTVVISAATFHLIEGYFTVEDLGRQALKGLPTPLQVYQVVGASAAQSRLEVAAATGLTPLVGRDADVALLCERWAQSRDGQGQVVLLSGEAGIGKSRLVEELTAHVRGEGARRMMFRCSPYHTHSAFFPVIAHLQRLLHWHQDETPEARVAKLEQALQPYGFVLQNVVPLFAALLSVPLPERYPPLTLSSQRQKQQTQEALVAWLLAEAEQQPVLAVWEDLHWADPSSLDFLRVLLDQTPTAPLLTLLVCRPEFDPPWPARAHGTQLTLTRCTRPQIEVMVRHIAGGKCLPAEVVQQISVKTDGVPLFVEELTKAIVESGLLRETAERYELIGPLPALAIPTTLQDALMARLDRLGTAKSLAQLGATIGRQFAYDLLREVAQGDDATVQRELGRLVEAELLYQRGLPPQAWYRFKHTLIQEAAYQSLLKSTRRQYHRQISQVLKAQFPETCELHPELLAHHALGGERWEKAVAYYQQAGTRAHARAAFREAVASFDQALQALAYLPESGETRVLALKLRLALTPPLNQLAEHGRRLALLGEAEALARALDDRARLAQVLARMGQVRMVTGDLDGALAAGQQALALAAELDESALQVEVARNLAQVYYAISDFRRSAELFRRGVEIADREVGTPMPDFRIRDRAHLARTLTALGAFAEGRRHGEEALRLATLEGRGVTPMMVRAYLGLLYLAQGDLEQALPVLEQGLTLCRASDLQNITPVIVAGLGFAYALQGRLAEGRTFLEEAIREDSRMGVRYMPDAVVWLSEVCRLAGRGEEAWEHARQALGLARQHRERANEARALHQLGTIYAHAGPPDTEQAEAHYQQALTLANELGMRPLQAHCYLGLGTLYAQTGRREQARAALSIASELYGAMEMTFWLPQIEAALTQVA